MKFFHAVLQNLAVSLNIALMIVIYLDMRNPMMGFLEGVPVYVLAASACITSIISAVMLYAAYRKNQKYRTSLYRHHPLSLDIGVYHGQSSARTLPCSLLF